MEEPFLSQFRELVRQGAAVQDIHDSTARTGYAVSRAGASQSFLDRELGRVRAYQKSLVPLLEELVGPAVSILDVGCGTGGTTVALALAPGLRPREVVGVDPNPLSVEAACVRAQGHGLSPSQVRFQQLSAGSPLPFANDHFRLAVCVSVLEFISRAEGRAFLASEMVRVTEPGGFLFVATPTPFRLREAHSRRVLGHFRHRDGYPWSSTPWAIRRMFRGCDCLPLHGYLVRDLARRYRWPGVRTLLALAPGLNLVWPWQKFLFRKRGETRASLTPAGLPGR